MFFFQLTQTNPPEFMGSTLKELGIGTYQNVAVVGGHKFYFIYFNLLSFLGHRKDKQAPYVLRSKLNNDLLNG